jgi:hypothetical protein
VGMRVDEGQRVERPGQVAGEAVGHGRLSGEMHTLFMRSNGRKFNPISRGQPGLGVFLFEPKLPSRVRPTPVVRAGCT